LNPFYTSYCNRLNDTLP
jgi:hypothetical protein